MNTQFSAGQSAIGYIYQLIHYALYIALNHENPDVYLRLEKLDDIDITDGSAPQESIQVKHKAKDLTNRSEDLWGPVRVWSENLNAGILKLPGTMLSLVTTAKAADGSIASLLRPPPNRQVDEALARMETESQRSTDTLKQAFTAFCSLQPNQRRDLVDAIHILDGAPHIGQIDQMIMAKFYGVRQTHLEDVYRELQGWWLDKVVEHLLGKSNTAISIVSVREKIADINDKYKDRLQDPFIDLRPPANYDYDTRTFVRQLRMIDLEPSLIDEAKYEYYRTSALRNWLVNEFHVRPLTAYDQGLVSEWKYRFYDIIRKRNAATCDEQGKKDIGHDIYQRIQQDVNRPIHRDITDLFYTRGSYQVLADAVGIPEVGWHPDYQSILQNTPEETDNAMGKEAG